MTVGALAGKEAGKGEVEAEEGTGPRMLGAEDSLMGAEGKVGWVVGKVERAGKVEGKVTGEEPGGRAAVEGEEVG